MASQGVPGAGASGTAPPPPPPPPPARPTRIESQAQMKKLKAPVKQPSLEDFHAEFMEKVSKTDLRRQQSSEGKKGVSPLVAATSGSCKHISPSGSNLSQPSHELIKKLSSEIEQKLADSAPTRAKLIKKFSQDKVESFDAEMPPSASSTPGSKRKRPAKRTGNVGSRRGKPAASKSKRRDSIAVMQKRKTRLSGHRASIYSSVPTADPVADAPPPPSGKICKFQPLTTPPVTYSKPSWKLTLRKEYFTPMEELENDVITDIIYQQIVNDVFKPTSIRLSEGDRETLLHLCDKHSIEPKRRETGAEVKREIIKKAKELPCYFAEIFRVKGKGPDSQLSHLGVTHRGLTFIRQTESWATLVPVDSYSYDSVVDCSGKAGLVTISLVAKGSTENHVFKTEYATAITEVVSSQLAELQKNARYVLGTQDYLTRETSLLSFPAGAVIKLQEKEGLDEGWLYGEYEGNCGSFPVEYSAPIACVGEVPTQAAVEKAMYLAQNEALEKGSKPTDQTALDEAASHSDLSTGLPSRLSHLYRVASGTDLSISRFANEHFRKGQERAEMVRKLEGSFKGLRFIGSLKESLRGGKKKASWSDTDTSELIRFSKSPIPVSLLQLDPSDVALNRLAVECFLAIMCFMGDYMSKGKGEEEHVLFLLKSGREHQELRDELYCQLMKQTTDNGSTKSDGCLHGWQLLLLCSAYFPCSKALLPYLMHYLHSHSSDAMGEFHVPATICEANLRKSFHLGGRREPPGTSEIQDLMAGRYTRRQVFYLPGDISKVLRIKTSTTAHDILHELCGMLGLQGEDDLEEFGIHADLGKQTLPLPLLPSDYVQDVASLLERQGLEYRLCYTKLLWYRPLRLDQPLYAELLYHQAKHDVLKGYLLPLEAGELSKKSVNMVCQLAALQWKVENERESAPTLKQTARLIPPSLSRHQKPQQWVEGVQCSYQKTAVSLSPSDAKRSYVDLASRLPMYGSRFFPITSSSGSQALGESLMAVNKKGVFFLDTKTKGELLSLSYDNIVSTRKLRSQAGRQYLDIKCGNLMQQTVLRCETPYGREISPVVAAYVKIRVEEQRKEDEAKGIVRELSFI